MDFYTILATGIRLEALVALAGGAVIGLVAVCRAICMLRFFLCGKKSFGVGANTRA